jgi:hypothetical protein
MYAKSNLITYVFDILVFTYVKFSDKFISICAQLSCMLELVSKELNHFGVIADLFRQIGGHSTRFVLFCSF